MGVINTVRSRQQETWGAPAIQPSGHATTALGAFAANAAPIGVGVSAAALGNAALLVRPPCQCQWPFSGRPCACLWRHRKRFSARGDSWL